MKVTKRERFMLFQALEWEIHRYLMSNTYGREDGVERAQRHMNISAIILSFITVKKYHEIHDFQKMKIIHDYLAEILTDRMDEVIGFPIKKEIHDYDEYVWRFFNVVIEHINDIEKLVKNYKEERF